MAHRDPFHPTANRLSRGTFYFAHIGTSHFAATGIFIAPRTGWDFNRLGQTGFSATTPHVASPDGVTIASYYSDPFPNGFVAPTGSSPGLLTNVGGAISAPDRSPQAVMMQHWNMSLQRQVPGDIGIGLSYAGSNGSHLWLNLQYNQLADQYLALRNELQRVVPNPFRGIIPANQPLGGATTTYEQLLRPYPHFTGLSTIGSTSGSSTFHALEIRADKRYSHGLNFLIAYTATRWSTTARRAPASPGSATCRTSRTTTTGGRSEA